MPKGPGDIYLVKKRPFAKFYDLASDIIYSWQC